MVTAVLRVAVLDAGTAARMAFPNASTINTWVVFVTGAVTFMVILMVALSPAAKLPRLQARMPANVEHVPWLGTMASGFPPLAL